MRALPLAHLGHWYVQLAFAAPALVIIAYMLLTGWRERVRHGRGRREPRHKRERDR